MFDDNVKSTITDIDGESAIPVYSTDNDASSLNVRIGMFHPHAGTRNAGGIAVYTQRIVEKLSELTSTVLYTMNGHSLKRLDGDRLEVVSLSSIKSDVGSRVLVDLPNPIRYILDRCPIYTGLWTEGVFDHIDENADVVVTHDTLDELVISNVVDVPTVRIQHGLRKFGIGSMMREKFSQSTLTLANSQYAAQRMEHKLGYEPDGIVPPGVDVDIFHPDVDPLFRTDDTDILYVGRIVKSKGIFELVEALAKLPDDYTLHIVGRGNVKAVIQLAEELNVEDSVIFHGSIPNRELPRYYTGCDVFCNPSHYETFGMVNLEAMACGAPVVSSDIDGISEYLVPGETGLVVSPGDPDQFAESIERLSISPSLQTKLGRSGRKTAENYTWEASAKKLYELSTSV